MFVAEFVTDNSHLVSNELYAFCTSAHDFFVCPHVLQKLSDAISALPIRPYRNSDRQTMLVGQVTSGDLSFDEGAAEDSYEEHEDF